jgi:aminoglycoside phosphotransferase (APT) family kinase protein
MHSEALAAPAQLAGSLEAILGAPVCLEELKHKRGRRRTLGATGPRGEAIVKLYASERAVTVAGRIQALGAGPPEPELPRVLLVDPARRLVVLSRVPGEPLRHALLAADAEACGRAGGALAAWHGFWSRRAPGALRRHTSERELAIVEARAGALSPALARRVERLARRLSAPWPLSTVVHRDLYEEQVLVGERIGLIDLDDAAIGPPELDVGNLLAHVELLALRAGQDLAGVTDSFLTEYGRSGAVLDPDLLARCRRLSLLRLACIHGEPVMLERAAR